MGLDVRGILGTMYKYKGVEIIEDAVCADHVHMCVSIPENKHFKFYGISEREKYANDI